MQQAVTHLLVMRQHAMRQHVILQHVILQPATRQHVTVLHRIKWKPLNCTGRSQDTPRVYV